MRINMIKKILKDKIYKEEHLDEIFNNVNVMIDKVYYDYLINYSSTYKEDIPFDITFFTPEGYFSVIGYYDGYGIAYRYLIGENRPSQPYYDLETCIEMLAREWISIDKEDN